jgi:hypothetical protein
MSALQVAALFGAAIVLGTGHLCVGLAIGWFTGKRAGMIVQPVNMEPFVASVEQIRGDLGQLSRMSHEVTFPDQESAELLARLTLSLDELHRSLSSRVCAKPNVPSVATQDASPASEDRSHTLGAHAVGNTRILEWFQDRTAGRAALSEKNRYPFALKQPLAVRQGEELPEPGDFELVQCHDISPSEVRYIVEDRPKDDDVVIGLGIPRPIKYLLARVEDYRSVYMYGRVGFLVTASFVETLDGYSLDAVSQEVTEAVR